MTIEYSSAAEMHAAHKARMARLWPPNPRPVFPAPVPVLAPETGIPSEEDKHRARQRAAIARQANQAPARKKQWTRENEDLVIDGVRSGYAYHVIGKILGRSHKAIKMKISFLKRDGRMP